MDRFWFGVVMTIGCASDRSDVERSAAEVGDATPDRVETSGATEVELAPLSDAAADEVTGAPDAADASEPPDIATTDLAGPDVEADAPDGAVGPPPSCVESSGCALLAEAPVCWTLDPTQVYPNECAYVCAMGSTAGMAPVDTPECCPFDDCDPVWASLGPVCVEDPAWVYTQFPNPFAACCSEGHYVVLTDPRVQLGPCFFPGDPDDPAVCSADCPNDFAPVCGKKDDGTVATYQNSCVLVGCGLDLECNAPCADVVSCPQCAGEGQCEPICGVDGQTYRNSCYAACLGQTTAQYPGACCDCPPASPEALYCSTDGTTHANLCWLTCKDAIPAYQGPCIVGCKPSPVDDPPYGVCGFYQGANTRFINVECAALAGATCIYEGPCAPGTNVCAETNPEYAPVCATPPGASSPITFDNACHAGCAAAEIQSVGPCP